MKIGIPNGDLYDKLVNNYSNMPEAKDIILLREDDAKLGEMFKNKELDLAFLSPLAYSAGVSDEEYRIVPTTCVALEGYSGHFSIYFNPRARRLATLAARSESEYWTVAAQVVLAERYELFPKINVEDVDNKDTDDLLSRSDMALILRTSDANESSIDVCEQWFDTYEFPLLAGCWICRAYEHKVKDEESNEQPDTETLESPEETKYNDMMKDICERLAAPDLEAEVPVIQEFKIGGQDHERKGIIHYRWSADIAAAMSETMQILFVLRFFELVPAVKVLGDNTDYFAEMQSHDKDEEDDDQKDHLEIEYGKRDEDDEEDEDEECECGHHHHHHHHDEHCDCNEKFEDDYELL